MSKENTSDKNNHIPILCRKSITNTLRKALGVLVFGSQILLLLLIVLASPIIYSLLNGLTAWWKQKYNIVAIFFLKLKQCYRQSKAAEEMP